jgi:hypothetical protein
MLITVAGEGEEGIHLEKCILKGLNKTANVTIGKDVKLNNSVAMQQGQGTTICMNTRENETHHAVAEEMKDSR